MAKVTFNPAVGHLHGHIGKLVFKEQAGRDVVSTKPDQVNQPNSTAQLAQRDLFKKAATYAKGAMSDSAAHAAYLAKAKELRSSPMAVAVKDYMSAPQVTALDVSQYAKHVGNAIYVTAVDDFEVKGVMVTITDSNHAAIESGQAAVDSATGLWKYSATVDCSTKTNVNVTATATDRPGNTGTLTVTK